MYTIALLVALASATSATKLGFNYGSTFTTGAAKMQSDFEAEFTTAANLKGTSGWTSARLYTMVQGGTASDPISAIPAAIKTKTSLLLGLWASGGDATFANEISALKAAIATYGDDLSSLVDGISIGSEDLYRNSPQGIAAGSNPGVDPDVLLKYIQHVKDTIAGTALDGALLGHVDTWTAWDNSSNSVVVDALDWIGMDAYPYFQDTMPNAIGQSKSLFQTALGRTQAAAGGKAVWVTETGHPVSGKQSGDSIASAQNAEDYWKTVGCPMFGNTNVWWYTLQDAAPDTPNPSFGIIGSELTTTPLFDLSCDDVETEPSSSSSAASKSTSTPVSESTSARPTATSGEVTTTTSETESKSTVVSGDHSASSSASSGEESTTLIPSTTLVPTSTGAATGTGSSSIPASSGTGSSNTGSSGTGSGSSSGSDSGSSSGSDSSASSGVTSTSLTPSSTSPTSPEQAQAAGLQSGALGAAFVAILAAIFYL
ncbi:glycoside hydrolase family 17 protein [Xylaria sp. FL0933]|nr:glycoside hydrolase family 17 protein [Xylaria sp. FL0933]